MELRQLVYFVAVAEERQFTRAAERIAVAQPAVSAQIRRLESELGETLFHRDKRATRLTIAGEAFMPHARAALAAIQDGRDTIASLRNVLRGRLRVGVSTPVDRRLAETLGEFHRSYPAVDIALTEQHNAPTLTSLADGDFDAAFIGFHGQQLPATIRTRVVAAEPLVLAVRPGHPLADQRTVTVEDLRDQPVVTLVGGSGLRTVLDNACGDAGFVPHIVAQTGELGSLADLAAEGLGVAVLPLSAARRPDLTLTLVTIARPRLRRRTALAWNPAATTPAGRAFLALADKHYPRQRAATPDPHTTPH
jgi:DNA-binding transcriptional LysR family regulator